MEEEEKMREEELKEMSDKMRERWLQNNQTNEPKSTLLDAGHPKPDLVA